MKKLILVFVLLFAGCGELRPVYRYRIDLVTPTGEIHKTWYLERTKQPIIAERWGGQTLVVPWTLGIEAPTGWLLDVTNEGEIQSEN